METFKNKKWTRLHLSIPEEMIHLVHIGRSPGLLHSPIPFPCECIVALNRRQLYSCGDSVGIQPNFPIKLHIVVPI